MIGRASCHPLLENEETVKGGGADRVGGGGLARSFGGDVAMRRRVAVIGGGVAGLCAAWQLQRCGKFDVTLFEKQPRLGGNAHTVELDGGLRVDVGFLVFNSATYPNLLALFRELGVESVESDMSFAVSVPTNCGGRRVEWSSQSLDTLFSQRSNLLRPAFHAMIRDMLRFNVQMPAFLAKYEEHDPGGGPTVGEFLQERNYSDSFVRWYLLPMIASVWSSSARDVMQTPAQLLFRFFHNHRLAQVFDRPRWRTVRGGSATYVARIEEDLRQHGTRIHLRAAVRSVRRRDDGVELLVDEDGSSASATSSSSSLHFDDVVFATHAPDTLQMLGEDADEDERALLSCFGYETAECVVHTDASWMPKRRQAWASWNFVLPDDAPERETEAAAAARLHERDKATSAEPVCVTYYLNNLQRRNLPPGALDVFETLNPRRAIEERHVLRRFRMAHPQFTKEGFAAQHRLRSLQGRRCAYFCGSWARYGFHEDGARSGFEVAQQLSGTAVPWRAKLPLWERLEMRHAEGGGGAYGEAVERAAAAPTETRALVASMLSRVLVDSFMQQSVQLGSLHVIDHKGEEMRLGESDAQAQVQKRPRVRMYVLSPEFYTQVASAADIGFAEAYMLGRVDFESFDQLLQMFQLLILNRDAGSLDARRLNSSRIGAMFNNAIHSILRRNTLAGSRKNIAAHYDLSNELFSTFLGKTWMYSCALWERGVRSLDEAQELKLERILRACKLDERCHVLEIGCGWGELAIRAALRSGCRVTGITLSERQLELARQRAAHAGVSDLVSFRLCDYRDVQGQFDRIVSIEMLEAVGHEFLGDFFAACERTLKPNGLLLVQVITVPEDRYDVYRRSADFISKYIFPGGCCPSVSSLLAAMSSRSRLTVERVLNFAPHYVRTLAAWREAFNSEHKRVRALGFDELFVRMWNYYFTYCEAGFASRTLGLHQMVFTRPGNAALLDGTEEATNSTRTMLLQ